MSVSTGWIILLGFLVAGPMLSEEVTVEISSKAGALAGTALLIDGEFVGGLGDVIRLSPGKYQASFQGKYGYQFNLTLNVIPGAVQLLKHEAKRWSDCIENHVDHHTVKAGPPPEVKKFDTKGLIWWRIVFVEPEYEGNYEKQSRCDELPSMIALRTLGSVTLNLSSAPSGASIYIQGKEEGVTDKKLVVPFREREDAIRVVVRKAGYVNCATKIRLPASGTHQVHCALLAVPKKP